jgi:outer membrane protein assembly factor BamB
MKFLYKTLPLALVSTLLLSACSGTDTAPSSFPGAMVQGDAVYLSRGGHVYKHDIQTGNEIWRFPLQEVVERGPFAGQPVKMGNVIVVGEGINFATSGGLFSQEYYTSRSLFGLSEDTGIEVWRFTAPREFVDGVVTDGKLIFAANGDGKLYAIDPAQRESGQPKIVWTFDESKNKLWSKPLLADGKVYQASMDHKLYAVDANTGKKLWEFQAGAPIAVQPSISNGTLYFGAFDSKFYAVDAATGAKKWEQPTSGWVWSEATLSNGVIYFGDVRGRVFALDSANGATKWTFDAKDAIRAQPILKDDTLYVVSFDTNAYAIKIADGKGIWTTPPTLNYRLPAKPSIVGDSLLVTLFDSEIRMWTLDLNTGARRIQFPPAKK